MRRKVAALTISVGLLGSATLVGTASAASAGAHDDPQVVMADERGLSFAGGLDRIDLTDGAMSLAPEPRGLRSGQAAGFAFMATNDDGTPVRWNPCQTITWQWSKAKKRDLKLMRKAVTKVAAATGMTFEMSSSSPSVKIRYSPRPRSQGALGLGGFRYTGFATGQVVEGFIEVDKRLKKKKFKKRISKAVRKELFMHEWGHVVGLDHVDSTEEIMFPAVGGFLRNFGVGDREGLALVGIGAGCEF